MPSRPTGIESANLRSLARRSNQLSYAAAFKDIHLIENHKFGRLPRKKLLEVIIENMRKRLIDNEHLTSKNNDQEGIEFHQVINLLEPDTWNIQKVVVPWLVAKEKLYRFSDIFHYKISINDFRDYVESVLQNF